ncbi:hypothetical protein AYO21_06351 [Fonsecaea monophora]|uniref:VOC domain-containing protein n=1 Tax=Fonsecaea monophora TaxID=254056 RepID=A0A177F501_9EURO|nr:hypothetical protein AYO21_06351 [Fonsecaea monophora]KAH0831519.1 dioxygenase superfamily protein [Fonsecaea pedrosoi]OAG39335.1 hypothetical protein AYO21_06351 [Fonsecaea monophora]
MAIISHPNHVAVSVPDAAKAAEFYTQVLGLKVLVPDNTMNAEDAGGVPRKIYGKELQRVRSIILTASNGIGFEIFEFVAPKYNGPQQRPEWGPDSYTRGGFFHVGFVVADIDETVAACERLGGKLVGEKVHPVPGEAALYMQDPWGNIIELMTCGFDQMFSQVISAGRFNNSRT